MYKIRLNSMDNINETIEIITADINEALDELLMFRKEFFDSIKINN